MLTSGQSERVIVKFRWLFITVILGLAVIIILHRETFGPVGCKAGNKQPELRLFYPLQSKSRDIDSILQDSKIKSYRSGKIRTDRYFLCTNTSLSIKLRNQNDLEIKLLDQFESIFGVEYWTKHILTESPKEPNWDQITSLLENCETFSWIPDTGACKMWATVDVKKKVAKQRVKINSLSKRLQTPIKECLRVSTQNHAVSIETGFVELIVHTFDGPKTIGRYNTISIEDGPDKTIRCTMDALTSYLPGGGMIGAYPKFISNEISEYRKSRQHETLL